ncbi:MAG: peptidase [Myxococcales bacterium]|nr:peptidase [Myxococcales bacterium]
MRAHTAMRAHTTIALIVAAGCASHGVERRQATATAATAAAKPVVADPEAWRAQAPPLKSMAPYSPPTVVHTTLANGIPLYVVENRRTPIVAVRLVVRAGSAAVGSEQAGLPALVARTVVSGAAGSHSADALANELAKLGASTDASTTRDASFLSMEVLRDALAPALDRFADLVLRPALAADEVARARDELAAELRRRATEPMSAAEDALRRISYGPAHAYAASDLGTATTLDKLTPKDVAALHRRLWRPRNLALIVAGDIDVASAKALLDARFGGWKDAGAHGTPPSLPLPPPSRARRVVLIDRPHARQAVVALGGLSPPRRADEWSALTVMNTVFGYDYASRLSLKLREASGFTYSIRSRLIPSVGAGQLMVRAGIALEKTASALRAIFAEMDAMRAQPPAPAELEAARQASAQSLASRLETDVDVAALVADAFIFALPDDFLSRTIGALGSISAMDVRAAAVELLRHETMPVIVVGPAQQLEPQLRAAGLGDVELLRTAD